MNAPNGALALPPREPLLLVLSGPSGVGKDAVLNRIKELKRPFHFTVTATTRRRRPAERDGVDYFFLSQEEFQGMIQRGELLEWAQVYGNYYGVPKAQVEEALAKGLDLIIKADVQGARTIKRFAPQGVFIFLAPESIKELEQRLAQRNTEASFDLKRRLETVRQEMKSLPMFDYLVVNHQDRLDEAVAQIEAIVTAERCRVSPRRVRL